LTSIYSPKKAAPWPTRSVRCAAYGVLVMMAIL
jgi:hypothetical protein